MHSVAKRITFVIFIAALAASVAYYILLPIVTRPYLTYSIVNTESGFVPSQLVVLEGGVVRFSNETDEYYWPASDLHPSHLVYSEFDPRRALEPTEDWEFLFSQEGQWLFHDHLRSHFGGTIYVTSAPERPLGIECTYADKSNRECWNTLLSNEMRERGLDATLALLRNLHDNDPKFANSCHDLAHDVGLKAYIKYKRDVPLIPETRYCNAGFYHGYMEGFLNDKFDPEAAVAFCEKVAKTLSRTFPNAENQCRHGIGHGVEEHTMRTHPYLWDDPKELTRRGIEVCEEVNETYDQKRRCSAGVFSVFGDWLLTNDLLNEYLVGEYFQLCTETAGQYAKEGCYWEFAKRLKTIHDSNYADAFVQLQRELLDAPEEIQALAARSLGISLGKRGVYASDDAVLSICRNLAPVFREACTGGLVEGLLFAGKPDEEFKRAILFCSSESLEDSEQRNCFRAVQERAAVTKPAAVLPDICNDIPEEFSDETFCS